MVVQGAKKTHQQLKSRIVPTKGPSRRRGDERFTIDAKKGVKLTSSLFKANLKSSAICWSSSGVGSKDIFFCFLRGTSECYLQKKDQVPESMEKENK
jgi:hypothetical protein